jgi:hypothetical protein
VAPVGSGPPRSSTWRLERPSSGAVVRVIQDRSGASDEAEIRVCVLGGFSSELLSSAVQAYGCRGCWPLSGGLTGQTACTPAEGLQLEQRGRAQSGAAARQLSESNLRGFPRA